MSQVRTRTTFQRGAAAVAALALAAGGAVTLTATSANAAAEPVSKASATWGFKESFRSYLGSAANNDPGGATITVAQGAAFTGGTTVGTPPRNTSSYTWPAATSNGGSYDPVTRSGTVHLGGKVTYTLTKHYINEVSISNPTVVLNGNGTGTLLADTKRNLWGSDSGTPVDEGTGTQVVVANLSAVPLPTVSTTSGGQTDTFNAIPAKITAEGVAALGLGSFYAAGATIDPVTFSVEHAPLAQTVSTTTVTLSPATVAYGKARTAKVSVTGSSIATGSVTLKEGARSFGTAALIGGAATIKLPANLSVGKHALTASFPGSVGLLASSKVATLTVTKATPKVSAKLAKKSVKVGKKGKLTATVTAAGFVPTGKVSVKEGKKTLKTVTLTNGKATITLPKLKKGKHKLVVRYAGSSVANVATSSKVTLTVKR